MRLWFRDDLSLTMINDVVKSTMSEHLGIVFSDLGDNFMEATMPVDHRTRQPYGLLHGGASCVLAETLGSLASSLVIDTSKLICVGIEINANHIRSAREGIVRGRVEPLHLGSTTHVWDIRIYDEHKKLSCISRLTVAILPKKQ